MSVACHDDNRWLVMSRGSVRTVVNLASEPQTVPLDRPVAGVLLAWEPDSTQPVRARPAQ